MASDSESAVSDPGAVPSIATGAGNRGTTSTIRAEREAGQDPKSSGTEKGSRARLRGGPCPRTATRRSEPPIHWPAPRDGAPPRSRDVESDLAFATSTHH